MSLRQQPLDSAVMTIVATWVLPEQNRIWAVADSRASTGDGSKALLDEAPKLFTLDVRVVTADLERKPQAHSTYGIGYAGSGLIALSSINVLQFALRDLVCGPAMSEALPTGITPPSLNDVANAAGRTAQRVAASHRAVYGNNDTATLILFGYCPINQAPEIYTVSVSGEAPGPVVLHHTIPDPFDPDPQSLTVIGSHKDDFVARVREHEARYVATATMAPKHVLQELVSDNTFPDVGGTVVNAVADPGGAQVFASVLPIPGQAPNATIKIFGVDIYEDIGLVGQCIPVVMGMV